MAHFASGRSHKRISGQTVHVPIGSHGSIALYGPIDFDGNYLDIVPDDETIVSISTAGESGDFCSYTLAGLRVGITTLRAIATGNSEWDQCEVHVHMPRIRQLPRWNDLFSNYSGEAETSDDFEKRIGGQVVGIGNTCTARLSEAFMKAGHPVPGGRANLEVRYGADHKPYAIKVAQFGPYLRSAYGEPDIVGKPPKDKALGVDRKQFAGVRGVIGFDADFGPTSDATGHFTLWDGSKCVRGDHFTRAYRVSLWLAE